MISLIIITFNSKALIKDCLDSIATQSYKDFEIIIVDNASKDSTTAFIKTNYPNVILVKNQKNLGAAKARNQGIEIAKGEWILTLDGDVILDKCFLAEFSEAIEHLPQKVGIIQPKILCSDKLRIFSAGISMTWLKRFYDIGRGKPAGGRFNIPGYVFGACSAAAVYKRQLLEDVKDINGYFDERLFFLFEDVDLSWRAQERGWRTLFCPSLVSYHYGNSSQTPKEIRQYLCWRNRKLILKKHKQNKLRLFLISVCYDLPRAIFILFTNSYARHKIGNFRRIKDRD